MNNDFITTTEKSNAIINQSNIDNTNIDNEPTHNSITYESLLNEMEHKTQVNDIINGNTILQGNDYLEHEFDNYEDKTGSGIDLNIENYSVNDLYSLVNIDKQVASIGIIMETIMTIKQEFREHKLPAVVNFFDNVENILVYDMENNVLPLREQLNNNNIEKNNDTGEIINENINNTLKNNSEINTDDTNNISENDRDNETTNENQYGDQGESLIPFNDQNNDGVNPLLRENFTRIISIDSFFRHNSLPSLQNITYASLGNDYSSVFSTTNFVATLSEPITFVTRLLLESVHIPNTFYNIDDAYGNNVLFFRFTDGTFQTSDLKVIQISKGNYDITTLIDEIIEQLNTVLSTGGAITPSNIFFNNKTGKVEFIFDDPYEIVFYDNNVNNFFTNNNLPIPLILPKINYNLGWLLGFRDPIYKVITANTLLKYALKSDAVVDLRGPRYFVIVIDDFNHNHLNKAIVSAENKRTKPALPNYDTENLNIEVRDGVSNYQQVADGENIDNYPIVGEYPFYSRQEAKKLTQAQLYSLNEITKERQKRTTLVIDSPTENNVFGIIPNTLRNNNNFGDSILLTSNQIQENTRHYFGKVDIERLAVRLYDDKGNLMNLNGNDWSFTIRALCSYNVNNKEDYIQYSHNLHY
jgi:hypothetical protein